MLHLARFWAKAVFGGRELAEEVIKLCEKPNEFQFAYDDTLSIKEKIEAIAKKIYHADSVNFVEKAPKQLEELEALGRNMPEVKRIRFFMTFGQSYLTHMNCLRM